MIGTIIIMINNEYILNIYDFSFNMYVIWKSKCLKLYVNILYSKLLFQHMYTPIKLQLNNGLKV